MPLRLPKDANHDSIDDISRRARALGPNDQRTVAPLSDEGVAATVPIRPLAESIRKAEQKEKVQVMIPALAMHGLQALADKLQILLAGDLDEDTLDRVVKEATRVLRSLKKRNAYRRA